MYCYIFWRLRQSSLIGSVQCRLHQNKNESFNLTLLFMEAIDETDQSANSCRHTMANTCYCHSQTLYVYVTKGIMSE